MIDIQLLALFLPTFFLVSITPGMCMILSMSLGLALGVRRTLWMMVGELTGVALVVTISAIGFAQIFLNYPSFFTLFKVLGAAYLVYVGVQLWFGESRLAIREQAIDSQAVSIASLMSQGFVTAIANPKGWAFFIALLPPFISQEHPLHTQLLVYLILILTIEWICLMIYAGAGKTLKALLMTKGKLKLLNGLTGGLIISVAIWLVLS